MTRPYTDKQLKERISYEFNCPIEKIGRKEMQLAIRLYKIAEDMNRYAYFETCNNVYEARHSFIKEVRNMMNKHYQTEAQTIKQEGRY